MLYAELKLFSYIFLRFWETVYLIFCESDSHLWFSIIILVLEFCWIQAYI